MTVYEVGIISCAGLPIIHIDFRTGVGGDPIMKAGFLTALQQFVKSAFSDETQSFSMKKYAIFFSKTDLMKNQEEASVYVVCDREKNPKLIQDRIKSICKQLKDTFISLDDPCIGESELANNFKEFLMKEFEDLKMKPEERARKLFG